MAAYIRRTPDPYRRADACARGNTDRFGAWVIRARRADHRSWWSAIVTKQASAREETAGRRRRVHALDGQPKDIVQLIGVGAVLLAEIQARGSFGSRRVQGIAFIERYARLFGIIRGRVRGRLKRGR